MTGIQVIKKCSSFIFINNCYSTIIIHMRWTSAHGTRNNESNDYKTYTTQPNRTCNFTYTAKNAKFRRCFFLLSFSFFSVQFYTTYFTYVLFLCKHRPERRFKKNGSRAKMKLYNELCSESSRMLLANEKKKLQFNEMRKN